MNCLLQTTNLICNKMFFFKINLCFFYIFYIVLEVYQFARDAAVAEAWLVAQEPYLMSTELGVSSFLTFVKQTSLLY